MHEDTERTGESLPRTDDTPRINVWRVGKKMLVALVIPCMAAIAIDVLAGTWPLLTLVVAGFAFPIAGFVVMRSALQELQRVIAEIAPEEPEGNGVDDAEIDSRASPL